MPALTSIIAGVGLAAGAAGSAIQYQGAQAAASAQKGAERVRQSAMNFDSLRRQRQLVREQQIANANALSTATNQGAQFGSGLAGGQAQVTAATNTGIVANRNAQSFGNQEFGFNAQATDARTAEATGSGLSSLGGAVVKNNDTLARAGMYAYNAIS